MSDDRKKQVVKTVMDDDVSDGSTSQGGVWAGSPPASRPTHRRTTLDSEHDLSPAPTTARGIGGISMTPAAGSAAASDVRFANSGRGVRTVFDDGDPVEGSGAEVSGSTGLPKGRAICGALLSEDRRSMYPLRVESNRVGRGTKCEIILNDARVSEFQCNIMCDPDGVHVMPEAAAANRTVLDGKKLVYPAEAKSGSVLEIGGLSFRIYLFA